ncbi:MAG TPA: lipid-binding SYLF domain-containing protein [Candidatus Bathyarchaeia archaeon]|nr:lipid-binding SYLF domain-containing protein [Candidatus Bathyarchaeia archaeon]
MCKARLVAGLMTLVLVATPWASPSPAQAASAAEINKDASAALAKLFEKVPEAKALAADAKGILIFPSIVKAGFLFGGQYGEGVLRKGGRVAGYYNSIAASYGLQAGVQSFGYALFFMTDSALAYLDKSEGFEIGVGPSIVVVDEGTAKTLTTTTGRKDVYAFIFSQKGLMAGLGLQGSKISRIEK